MRKNRLEGFSDGVFAIVITLLVLQVKLPEGSYADLKQGLPLLIPSVAAYALSFLLVGMYWVFHHYSFTLIEGVDGVLLWLNILSLLFISFLPFPTMMLGQYPFQTLPVVIYGSNLLLANMCGLAMLLYLRRTPRLTSRVFTEKLYRTQLRRYLGVNGLYAACLALAYASPAASLAMFALVGLYLVFRSMVLMGIGTCTPGLDAE